MTILKGIFGAMCTPFQENGKGIDIPRYQSHIDDLLEADVHGLVLCSGTGEYAYLTDEEKQTLIQEGVKHINGRCPTIAQTTALSTNECIDKARAAEDAGASAIMVMPPFLEPPSERGSKKGGMTMIACLLYTSPSPRDGLLSRMPSSA